MGEHEERDPTDLTFGSPPFGVCALAAILAGLALGFALTRGDLGFWLVGLGALILLGVSMVRPRGEPRGPPDDGRPTL